jgi:glycosyltransferase involved in cell wall biosynthesis
MPSLGFVTWDNDAPTGGTVYDRKLITELRALGIAVRQHELAGPWPEADASAQAELARALRAQPACLVDGILVGAAPDVVVAAVEAGHAVTMVVHLPISDELGLHPKRRERYAALEAQAVHAASGVVCPSHWGAAELRRRYGRTDIEVAAPGVEPAPAARGSLHAGLPRLLTLASLTPTKDQITLVRALARLTDLGWLADLVGFDLADPGYAARVRHEVAKAELADRIRITGPLIGPALDQRWDAADLLVLPSRVETFGLVVTEALAHGIPAIVSAGTGAVEALEQGATAQSRTTPGAAIRPGDPAPLADVLREWLTRPELRRAWREAALARRATLPGWQQTAAAVLSYLKRPRQPSLTRAGSPPASPPTTPPAPPR